MKQLSLADRYSDDLRQVYEQGRRDALGGHGVDAQYMASLDLRYGRARPPASFNQGQIAYMEGFRAGKAEGSKS